VGANFTLNTVAWNGRPYANAAIELLCRGEKGFLAMKVKDRRILQFLRELEESQKLAPWQKKAVKQAVKKLLHAGRVRCWHKAEKAINELLKTLLRVSIETLTSSERSDDESKGM